MHMTGAQGDMTMNLSGRKVGACDATAERRKREAQVASIQRQSDQAQDMMRQQRDQQVAQCAQAVETMEYGKLGAYGHCRQQPELCKAMQSDASNKPVASACTAWS